MILKTIQPLSILEQINSASNEIFTPKYQGNDDFGFKIAFEWLKNEMIKQKIGNPKHEMLWAWEYNTPENIKKCEDVIANQIEYYHNQNGGIILTLNKKDNEVLLSDYELWHYPLNYWRIPQSNEDANEWEELTKKDEYNFYQNKPLQIHNELITETWKAVFCLDKQNNQYIFDLPKKQLKALGLHKKQTHIQATFWSFCKDDILELEIIKA